MSRVIARFLCIVTVLLMVGLSVHAAGHPKEWVWAGPGMGHWIAPENWDPAGEPTIADCVYIRNNMAAVMDKPGSHAEVLELHLGDKEGQVGIVYQNVGTFRGGLVVLGDGEGGNGQYLMHSSETAGSPPASFVCETLQVGNVGGGTFTQSTGTVGAGELVMGREATGSGTYLLYGGRMACESAIIGVVSGGGLWNRFENRGTHVVTAGALTLGAATGSRGVYDLLGGASLDVTGDVIVGESGEGTFNQGGGEALVSGAVYVGKEITGEGTYYLSGGRLEAASTSVGSSGEGTMQCANADHVVAGDLVLGGGGRGVYRLLPAGELEVRRDLIVSHAGDGVFEHQGGNSEVARTLQIGSTTFGGAGTYTMQAGRVHADHIHVQKGLLDWVGGTIRAEHVTFEPGTTLRMGRSFGVPDLQSGRLFETDGPVTGLGHTTVEVTRGAVAEHPSGSAMIGKVVLGTADGFGQYLLSGTGDLWAGELTVGKDGPGQMRYSGEAALFCGSIHVGAHGEMNLLRDWAFSSTGNWDILGKVLASGHRLGLDGGGSMILHNEPNTFLAAGSLLLADESASDVTQQGGWAGFHSVYVGTDCTYLKTFGELEVNGVENHELVRQTNGTTAVSGDVANYHKLVAEGGSMTVDGLGNLFEWREGPGAPSAYPHPGSYVLGTAQLHTTSTRNETHAMVGGNARMTAGLLVNEAPPDPLDAPPAGTGPEWTVEERGVYLFDSGILEVSGAENRGLVVLADNAVLREKSGGGATAVTNYPGAQLRMGGDFVELGGGVPTGGCRFDHHLVNYGVFAYYGGTFAGLYEHRTDGRGFLQTDDFEAEGGIINHGVLSNAAWLNLAAGGPGLTNFGLLELSYGVLGGTGVHNEADGEICTEGFSTIDAPVDNAGLLHTLDVLTVGGNLHNLGGGLIELTPGQRLDQAGLTNDGVVEFLRGGVIGGSPVLNDESGLVRMEGGGAIEASVTNRGVIEVTSGGLSGGTALTCSIANLVANDGAIRIGQGARLHVRGEAPLSGLIALEGPDSTLSGDVLFNEGDLIGAGTVAMPLRNRGVVRAEYTAGTSPATEHSLVFTGSGNTNEGRIEVAAGNAVRFTRGMDENLGTIALEGGTFALEGDPAKASASDLRNRRLISGWGRVSCDHLSNEGHVGVGGGDLAVMGEVRNEGSMEVEAGSTLTFFDEVSGNGVGGPGTVRFLGGFRPGFSPGIAVFGGNVELGSAGALGIELADNDNGDRGDPHYDALEVAADAALGGTLELDWLAREGDPSSKFGGVYDIITYGGDLDGDFAVIAGTIGAAYIKDIDLAAKAPDGMHAVRITLYAQLDGDCDLDGDVDGDDLAVIEAGCAAADPDWFDGDMTFDGAVDHLDYLVWKDNAGTAAGESIPEPATALLLALGGALFALRRRSLMPVGPR